MDKTITTIVFESAYIVRLGLKGLVYRLGHQVKEFGSLDDIVQVETKLEPALIIVGPSAFEPGAKNTAKPLLEAFPNACTLACLLEVQRLLISNLIRLGVEAIMTLKASKKESEMALIQALRGRRYLTPPVAESVCDMLLKPGPETYLSPRESQVLQLVGRGRTAKEIGGMLNLSHYTIETHKKNIRRKLGVRNHAELVTEAIRSGLA